MDDNSIPPYLIDPSPEKNYPLGMTVELTREQEKLIERKLATGHYADKGEVIAEALELLQQQDEAAEEMREALRAAHERNADIDPQAAAALVEDVLGEHRQDHRR